MTKTVTLGIIIACMISTQVMGQSAEKRPANWAQPVVEGSNLFRVTDTLYRSEQPSTADQTWLSARNIQTVISLRSSGKRDQKELGALGIYLVHLPMRAWRISDKQVAQALQQIRLGQQKGGVLVHCYHGSDRTGLVIAMYRIIEQNWSIEAAQEEMKKGGYGFHPIWVNIDEFFTPERVNNIRLLLLQEKVAS